MTDPVNVRGQRTSTAVTCVALRRRRQTPVAQLRWQKPADGSKAMAMAQIRSHRTPRSLTYCPVPFRPEVLQGSDLRCLKSDGEHRYRDLPVSPRHIFPSGAAIHDRQRKSGAGVPQLRGKDPPHAPISLAVPQLPWHRTLISLPLCRLSTDLANGKRPACA